MIQNAPIGIFDSGFGGLTVFRAIAEALPEYDYIYLGDNARAPYGSLSHETVFEYSWQCTKWFFKQNCPMVIMACNTASAEALRQIQQKELTKLNDFHRVLGVIRPTAEVIGHYTRSGHVGVLGTKATIGSGAYVVESKKFFPDIKITQEACPMWVPLIENGEHHSQAADYFIRKHVQNLLSSDQKIDTLVLACTHYPLIQKQIEAAAGSHIKVINQGAIVAQSFVEYLNRHPEMENKISKGGTKTFFTTDSSQNFDEKAVEFFGEKVNSKRIAF